MSAILMRIGTFGRQLYYDVENYMFLLWCSDITACLRSTCWAFLRWVFWILKKTVSYSLHQAWPSQLVFIPSSAGNSAAWYMWAKWKWDNKMYSDDWEGPGWPGCLGPNPSSITHQLCSSWASDLTSSCLSFPICKMGVIMVASPNCYKHWMNKGDALREVPGTQTVLRHVSGCFGEDKQRSPKVLFARQIHQPGPKETTPSSKAWKSARTGSCGSFQQGSLRNVSGTKAIGRPTEKCDVSGKGLHETGPQALHQEGKISSRSKHYASAACAGLGQPLQHVSRWAMGLIFILKFCVCKIISIMSAECAENFTMINFVSSMQLVFSLMIKNIIQSVV